MRLRPVLLLGLALLAPVPTRAAYPVRTYPLGDSITNGATFGTRVRTPGGYRSLLDNLLTASGVPHQFVGSRADNSTPVLDATGQNRHDGWPGARVDQVDASITGWLAGGLAPDVVIVHLGTNDIVQRFDPGTTYPTADGRANYGDPAQRALFLDHLGARLDALIDRIQAWQPDVRIVVSNAVPIATVAGTGAPWLVTAGYAAEVRQVVAAERAGGEPVSLADVYDRYVASTPDGPVVVPGLLTPDNVHPTPTGYAVLAYVYADAVLAALGRS